MGTDGRVRTQRLDEPFDLGRKFNWVLCLEVAEHIPRESEPVLLGNIRRHAANGLVLSWSEHASDAHPNARPPSGLRAPGLGWRCVQPSKQKVSRWTPKPRRVCDHVCRGCANR